MPSKWNSNPSVQDIQNAVAMDPKLKGELYSRKLEMTSHQHNAFEKFTSSAPKSGIHGGGGIRSIFCRKNDLKVGGGDTVNFNVLGPPGGPGVRGNDELTGNTSNVKMATYPVKVDWFRDAFEMDRDLYEKLSAGQILESTTLNMLAMKMGIQKQHDQMVRLNKSADGNVFRPNNRASLNGLLPTDTLSLGSALNARARLTTLGATAINQKLSSTGSPIHGYLVFASNMAMLPVRNDDGYQTAIAQGDTRGDGNAAFSGQLVNWQGMPWYEYPIIDQAWDDYIGSPILAKGRLGVAFTVESAIGACKLITTAANTQSRYFQFFDGYDYKFTLDQTAAPDSTEYYAWIVNPDGSVGFVAYTGSGNNGNQITITKILTPDGAGVSTLGAKTVGELAINTTPDDDVWVGGNATIPTSGPSGAWTYTDEFAAGAMILQANAKGVTYGRSYVFGAMASCFAHGRIEMNEIAEKRDYGFVRGRGFETIFGTGVTTNANKKPVGYLLVEHAVEHEGYPTPSIVV